MNQMEEQVQNQLKDWLFQIQNSRHFKKFGDGGGGSACSLVRDTMYKYSKLAKEKMLQDNFIAFLWVFYRLSTICKYLQKQQNIEDQNSIDPEIEKITAEVRTTIFYDFDKIAMRTLKGGH